MNQNSRADLALFNEKAELLLSSTFAEAMLRNDSAYMFSWAAGAKAEAVLVGAEGESVDAAFFTLRMFVQNNDRISIGNIAAIYANDRDLAAHQVEFEEVRSELNSYFSQNNGICFSGQNYTNREILELFMYGRGHTNRQKEKELKSLTSNPIIGPMLLNQVNVVAAILICVINKIRLINNRVLFGA